GSLRALRRYLRKVRPVPKSEVFLRLTALIGEQSQFDWAHVGTLDVEGGRRPLWLFVIVLAYSRKCWAELVVDLSAYSLRRSLVRAAAYFGGCTRQWLTDNPKIVVLERQGDAVRFHPLLLELSAILHVAVRVCGVRKPQEKGIVERLIRFLKERFFAARKIRSIEEGNALLLDFIATIADERPHPQWPDRRIRDVWQEEQPKLLPLPSPLPATDLVAPIVADKTAFVRFDGNFYSVPSDYARKTLTLVADDRRVLLLNGSDEEVAAHARSWGRRVRLEDPAHRAELLAQKQAARKAKGLDRLRATVPTIEPLFVCWADAGRNLGSMTARTLKVLDLYGAEALGQAVAQALDKGIHDPGALATLCEQARIAENRPMPVSLEFADHVRDRDVLPHDLGGYDG
ncbi:MAG: IS21 family transposase, partial [Candidatus Eremiobacteraeota bacterium]|nr:IS21 family transposase [Candidatus Eremiobacteraeota bacterium]